MRLIDADALHRKVKMETNPYGKPTIDYDSGVKVLVWIDKAPTIDAVPVVRCKDCIHHTDEEPGMVYCPAVIGGWVSNDFFCGDGKRKENDE